MLKSRILFVVFIAACVFTACKNNPPYDPAAQRTVDDDLIKTYLKSNNITDVVKGPQGVYYKIVTQGTDPAQVQPGDGVSIHYVGKMLLKQLYFDSTATNDTANATKFLLMNAIQGWQAGIPLVKPGGRMRLIVPSPLAYQNRQINLIPPNSILDFDIQLIKIIDPKQFQNK